METPKLTEISMIAINSVTGKEERVVVFKGVTYDDLDAWLAQEVKCLQCEGDGTLKDFMDQRVDCSWCAGAGRLTLKALVEKLEVYDAQ